MSTMIGVRIIHPRARFARIARLDRANHKTRQFVTISKNQHQAEVEIHQLCSNAAGELESKKLLYTFHLHNLHADENDQAIPLYISAKYDGNSRLNISVSDNHRQLDSCTLSIRPETRKGGKIVVPLLLLLLLLLGGSGFFISKKITAPSEAFSGRAETRPSTHSASRSNSSSRSPRPQPQQRAARPSTSAQNSPIEEESRTEPQAQMENSGSSTTEESTASQSEDPVLAPTPEIHETITVYFTPNQTFLTDQTKQELEQLAELLEKAPRATVQMVGHTAIFGSEPEQYDISRMRVENAHNYLLAQGWEPEESADISWKGPSEPITLNPTQQQINRRVEIKIDNQAGQ